MNPTDFLSLAQRLAGNLKAANEQAEIRTIISRAYYAAFNEATRVVEQVVGMSLPPPDEHWALQMWLTKSKEGRALQAGTNLVELHKIRKRADYRMNDDPPMGFVKTAFEWAVRIIEAVAAIETDQTKRAQLRAEVIALDTEIKRTFVTYSRWRDSLARRPRVR